MAVVISVGARVGVRREAAQPNEQPMTRRLLNLPTLPSLLLFVAACVLWVRSYFVVEGVSASTAPGGLKFVICC